MSNMRPGEVSQVKALCEAICTLYPKDFEIRQYNHPVLGDRISLLISKSDEIDLDRIATIQFNITTRQIIITTESPARVFIITNFITLDGVM